MAVPGPYGISLFGACFAVFGTISNTINSITTYLEDHASGCKWLISMVSH